MAVATRLLTDADARPGPRIEQHALDLAHALPRLAVEARRVASAAVHGLHGRRQAGVGENFWQFRRFSFGEAAARVDWRRSARDDHLYVREREWESAHTVWLWADRSASMAYASSLAQAPKIERALVLTLALADLMVRGGERVGLIGTARPSSSRNVVERFAEAMLADRTAPQGLPAATALAPHTEAVLVGDFLAPAAETAARMAALASRGARGHLVMVADPVEETFPFAGRSELVDPEDGFRLTAGRVQALREGYVERLAAHREALRRDMRRFGWTLTLHRTDRPASQVLLALYPLLQASGGTRP
ncbi:DUF58 domain-containing protein [Labrys wisconsinensis]|uniref:Uncharacterized protein (DUF58 family) n=1 Tax=Labrys wisconsinensis TaxID=425677 RepID=A0ABU0JH63_9HYPH|nr:DUF58 domain-containing protein [Labrys wisconsinensis]MDQ0473631.1 uncharacterized protein (DUF58 family) [Labrys wisconsinensis]